MSVYDCQKWILFSLTELKVSKEPTAIFNEMPLVAVFSEHCHSVIHTLRQWILLCLVISKKYNILYSKFNLLSRRILIYLLLGSSFIKPDPNGVEVWFVSYFFFFLNMSILYSLHNHLSRTIWTFGQKLYFSQGVGVEPTTSLIRVCFRRHLPWLGLSPWLK